MGQVECRQLLPRQRRGLYVHADRWQFCFVQYFGDCSLGDQIETGERSARIHRSNIRAKLRELQYGFSKGWKLSAIRSDDSNVGQSRSRLLGIGYQFSRSNTSDIEYGTLSDHRQRDQPDVVYLESVADTVYRYPVIGPIERALADHSTKSAPDAPTSRQTRPPRRRNR